VLAGVSAGALCWFECGVTDSFGPGLAPLQDGLGLVSGSGCPHYDGEPLRRPTFQRLVGSRRLPAGLAIDNCAAVHFVDGEVAEVVASRPGAQAYRVARGEGGAVSETPLPARDLGSGSG